MNKEQIINGIKEKGPAFLFGTIIGAVIITAFTNREEIGEIVNTVIKGKKKNVKNDEHPTGN